MLSHNPEAQANLKQLPNYFDESALRFVQGDPQRHLPLLEKQLTRGTLSELLLNTDRLPMLSDLETKLAPEIVDSLLDLEPQNRRLIDSVYWVAQKPSGPALIERLVREGAPAQHFDSVRLDAHQRLTELFGPESPTMKRLLELEAHSGLNLARAAEFGNPDLIQRLLSCDNAAERLNSLGQFDPFPRFANSLGPNLDAIERAATLSLSDGLNISRLNHIIAERPEGAAVIAAELKRGATVSQLNDRTWLPGLALVTRHLSSEPQVLSQAVQHAERNRLNLWHVGSYLDGEPGTRVPAIKRVLSEGKPEVARDLVRLSMFPQAVAERIANDTASGAVRVETIIDHARDFQYGANFIELTAQHARKSTLTPKVIDELAATAKNSPPLSSPFVVREPNQWRSAMQVGFYHTLPEFAAHVQVATNIILDRFSPDRTIVLLGRDMNAFTPALRANGRNIIDFHFSRLQYTDANTVTRWKQEVPPNAVVIDSAVSGSIHDTIRAFDPTIEPYLLQSSGKYPQLLPDNHLRVLASDLERFPKMTGRCSGYRSSGAAICRLSSRDDRDLTPPSLHAADWNRALLQELGLSDWYVWRYRNFTAVPLSERLGISAPDRIQRHFQLVEDLRARSSR